MIKWGYIIGILWLNAASAQSLQAVTQQAMSLLNKQENFALQITIDTYNFSDNKLLGSYTQQFAKKGEVVYSKDFQGVEFLLDGDYIIILDRTDQTIMIDYSNEAYLKNVKFREMDIGKYIKAKDAGYKETLVLKNDSIMTFKVTYTSSSTSDSILVGFKHGYLSYLDAYYTNEGVSYRSHVAYSLPDISPFLGKMSFESYAIRTKEGLVPAPAYSNFELLSGQIK